MVEARLPLVTYLPEEISPGHLNVCEIVGSYVPRNPEKTVLYGVVARHFETFLARQRERGRLVPRFVEEEMRAFLDCGVLARGILRAFPEPGLHGRRRREMSEREQENERRISANRRNAQKSTGPQTTEGMALVSRDATKHGLLSWETLLANEDGSALEAFFHNLRAELSPVGELENLLVDRIISASWRLRRVLRIEGAILSWEELGKRVEHFQKEAKRYVDTTLPDLADFTVTRVTDELKHRAAPQELKEAESRRQGLTVGPAFSRLSRYEASIERGLCRALHERQRPQALRAGQAIPPLMAVDMDVNVDLVRD